MKFLFAAIPLVACCATVLAQNPNVDRAVSATAGSSPGFRTTAPGGTVLRDLSNLPQAPELFPGEIEDVGPQFLVAREQQAAAERKLFEAYFDTQLFYTSNALLTEKGNQDTGVMVFTLQAAFNLPQFEFAGGTVLPKVGYRHQWWLYSLDNTSNQLNNFDFAVGTVFIGAQHVWQNGWVATAALDFNRFLSAEDNWGEFYKELVPNYSIEKNIPIGEKAQLTLGFYGAYHFTNTPSQPADPDSTHINDRLDSAVGFTYIRELVPKLYLQANYRWMWSHYTENSNRNDFYNNAAIAMVYTFNDWASIRAFVSYENRNSTDDDVFDYGVWNSGGGVTFSAQF